MLSDEEFAAFAKEVVPFLHVTSRVEGAAYPDLLSQKGGRGFPYLVAMDAEGRVTALPEGRTVAGFRGAIEAGKAYTQKRGKADLPAADRIAMFRFDVKVGNLDAAAAKAAVASMKGLTKEQTAELEGVLLGFEIRGLAPKSREPEAQRAAGKAYAEMWAAGKEPTADEDAEPFFILMLEHAESAGDADLFERALGKLRDRFGKNPQAAGFFKKQEDRLAKLKEGKK